ncbi:MAG: extracellular solute-binding protein, partial [Clostridiales bacterium]|nr:extracellular solute-binding protein [Clostridiales bacterium]
GLLTAIDDHLDKLPNYQRRVAEWKLEEEINDWRELDGKLYALPGMNKDLMQPINLGIRKDLLKKYGLSVPETYEDFYRALKVMKQNDPSILGLTERDKAGGALFSVIARSFDTNGGYSMGNGANYIRSENRWVFAPVTEEFRDMLRFLNKLYKEGLLDNESFSQDMALFNNKLKNTGKAVAAVIWNGEQESVNLELQRNGVPDADFDVIFPPAGPGGTRLTKSASRLTGGLVVPLAVTKRDCFGDVMGLLDFMYSKEGSMLNSFGAEGVTYDLVGGELKMKPEIKTAVNTGGTLELAKDFGVTVSAFRVCTNYDFPSVFSSAKLDAFNTLLTERSGIPLDNPSMKFTEEEKNTEKILSADLKAYYGSMMIKFIVGDADLDGDWDKYTAELESKGYKELMRLVNAQWERRGQTAR